MPFVYDDLAEICRNNDTLISWLQEKELWDQVIQTNCWNADGYKLRTSRS